MKTTKIVCLEQTAEGGHLCQTMVGAFRFPAGWAEKPYEINVGDRIGQGVLIPFLTFENGIGQGVLIPFLTFENGNTDNKRTGGFGSTNKENK